MTARTIGAMVGLSICNPKTLQQHLDVEEILKAEGIRAILNNDEIGNALRHDPANRREWSAKSFDPSALGPDAVGSALDLLMTVSSQTDPVEWSRALEVTCASVAVQHAYKPAIAPGKFGYDGGPPKSDCVEVTVRELFDLSLWDESTGSFDLSRLPPTASQELIDLYERQGGGERWFHGLSDLPGCDYLMTSPNGGKPYKLTPPQLLLPCSATVDSCSRCTFS